MQALYESAQNRIIVLLIAAAVDLLVGDPLWLWHPVQGVGTLITLFEKMLRRLFAVPPPEEGQQYPANAAGQPGLPSPETVQAECPANAAGQSSLPMPDAAQAESPANAAGQPGLRSSGTAQAEYPANAAGQPGLPTPAAAQPERDRGFHIRERIAGVLMVILVLAASIGVTAFLLALCGKVHLYLRLAAEGILCGRLLALRSLGEAGISVRDPLMRGDVEGARRAVSMIVGRDTDRLDGEGIARAAVETVAENTSDGVTAPLIYMFLLGGIGGMLYKAVNTMDSMTGYKNARYRYFGTAAAKLDDLANFIPARLTAIFMVLACLLPGKTAVAVLEQMPAECQPEGGTSPRDQNMTEIKTGTGSGAVRREVLIPDATAALRIFRRDRLKSPSPNSAQTESVCAGALHLRLLGDTWYFGELHHKEEIGDGGRRVEAEDITRAVRLMNRTSFLMFAVGVAVLAVICLLG